MTNGGIEWIEFHCEEGKSAELGRFYETVFGWKVQVDPNMPDYAMFTDPGGTVGGAFTSSVPKGDGGTRIYITVASADAALDAVNKSGGETKQGKARISDEIGYWASVTGPAGKQIWSFARPQTK